MKPSDDTSSPPSHLHKDVHKTPDGLSLAVEHHQSAAPCRSIVVIVHGYADHQGRYAWLAKSLAERGHSVITYDQRGHGQSSGRRAYIASFDLYLDDLGAMLAKARIARPDVPLFLFGHSMGGAVSTLYCLEREAEIDGLILSSAALRLPDIAPLLQRFSSLVGRLLPHLPTVKLNLSHLSRDANVGKRAATDPLYYHGRMPARTGAELVSATQRIAQRMEELTIPILLFHGTEDRLTAPAGSTQLYSRAQSTDKTLALYPGFYHETYNEPEREQVLDEILEWLDERV